MGTWLAIFDNDGDVHAAISKRPDTTPLTTLLEEKGDEIFKDCDAIAIELDLEKDTGQAGGSAMPGSTTRRSLPQSPT